MTARLVVNIIFFVNGFILANWASKIPFLQTKYGMDNSDMGYILLGYSIGAFVAMPMSGWLIQRYGSRHVTFFSAVLMCFFFIVLPMAPYYSLLFIPFAFLGASCGVMDVAMNAQAVEVEKELNKPIMTFFHALFSIGMVFGGLAGSLVTRLNIDIQSHFVIVGLLSMSVMIVVRSGMMADKAQSKNEEEHFLVMPKGPVIGLGIIAFCCMIAEGAMSDWSTNYILNTVKSSPSLAAFGLTAFAAAMTIGRLFGDKGRERVGDDLILKWGGLLSIFGMIMIVSNLHLAIVILGFGIIGLGLSNIVPIVYSLSGDIEGVPTGVGIAMATTIGYSGFMFGPPLIGFMADAYSLRLAFGMLLILLVVMLILTMNINISMKSK